MPMFLALTSSCSRVIGLLSLTHSIGGNLYHDIMRKNLYAVALLLKTKELTDLLNFIANKIAVNSEYNGKQ